MCILIKYFIFNFVYNSYFEKCERLTVHAVCLRSLVNSYIVIILKKMDNTFEHIVGESKLQRKRTIA